MDGGMEVSSNTGQKDLAIDQGVFSLDQLTIGSTLLI